MDISLSCGKWNSLKYRFIFVWLVIVIIKNYNTSLLKDGAYFKHIMRQKNRLWIMHQHKRLMDWIIPIVSFCLTILIKIFLWEFFRTFWRWKREFIKNANWWSCFFITSFIWFWNSSFETNDVKIFSRTNEI